MTTPTTKTCTKCGETKTLDGFYRKRDGKHGRTAYCKTCDAARTRAYYEAHREERVARRRAYRAEHREEDVARKRARYALVGSPKESAKIAARYATRSGAWSPEEDAYLIASTESQLDIALALKRTLPAVSCRRRALRSRGVLLACDAPETSTPVLVKESA